MSTDTYDETRKTRHHIIRLVSTADDLTDGQIQRLDAALDYAVHWSEKGDIDSESMIDYDAHRLPWDLGGEMTVTRTAAGRRAAATYHIESFLEDWDRGEWMQDSGEWVSEQWEDERTAYDEAVEKLRDAVDSLPSGDGVSDPDDLPALTDLVEAVVAAAKALDGQVLPDEGDYIETGTIDPDGVADDAEEIDGVGGSWRGWDCREGWSAHTHQGALYMRWWRDAWGDRHDRDLWVHVCDGFDA